MDVCGILTDQPTHERARNYWKVLKNRLKKEGSEVVTNCNRLKLIAEDGKPRETDVADMAAMFRVIESIPSKKAEPIKVWITKVAAERINQAIDPERSGGRDSTEGAYRSEGPCPQAELGLCITKSEKIKKPQIAPTAVCGLLLSANQ